MPPGGNLHLRGAGAGSTLGCPHHFFTKDVLMLLSRRDQILRLAGCTAVAASLAAAPALSGAQDAPPPAPPAEPELIEPEFQQPEMPEVPEPEAEEEAKELIQKLEETLANADSVQFEEKTVLRMPEMGDMEMVQSKMSFWATRPNQFRADLYDGEQEEPSLVVASDGETLTQYYGGDGPQGPMSLYDQGDAPSELTEAIEESPFLGSISLALMAQPGSFEQAFGPMTQFDFLGTETDEDGEEHHLLSFAVPGMMSGEMKTTADDNPLLQEVKINQMQQQDVDVAFHFENWRIDESISADRFQYTPPSGAEQVSSLLQTLTQPQAPPPQQQQQQAPPPPAPDAPQQAPPPPQPQP